MNAFFKKPLKAALVVGFLLVFQTTFLLAQTKIIAHKSHAGQATGFDISGGDGYGLPPKRILKIEKLGDTAVVFHHSVPFWANDTMLKHPLLTKKPDKIKKMYGEEVELIGFKKTGKKKKNAFPFLFVDTGGNGPALGIMMLALVCFIVVSIRVKKTRMIMIPMVLLLGLQPMILSAQTKIIAHRSHSGQSDGFNLGSGDHFGEPPTRIMKIEKMSDSLVVFHDFFYGNDTVLLSPILDMSKDSVQYWYGDKVDIVGFDKKDTVKVSQKEKKEKNSFYLIIPNGGPHLPAMAILMSFLCGLICFTGFWFFYRKKLLYISV